MVSEVLSEVCIAEIAFSKLIIPRGTDTLGQRSELEVKLKALRCDEGTLRAALEEIPSGALPFAGELIRVLKATLPDERHLAPGVVAAERMLRRCYRVNADGNIQFHTPGTGFGQIIDASIVELGDDTEMLYDLRRVAS